MTSFRQSPSGKFENVENVFPITQPEWFIASDGNNLNDGFTRETALLTIGEFDARTTGGEFQQPTQVEVYGSHPNEAFNGSYVTAPDASLLVKGMTPTENLSGGILTGVTAPVTTLGGEATTLAAAAIDFTPFVGQMIRFTSGAALGNRCWIKAIDPNGEGGTSNVRVSDPGSQLSDFELFNYNTTLPSIGDSFVIETLTRIGGIDVSIRGAFKTNTNPLIRRTQFQDFDITKGFSNSVVSVQDSQGPIIFGCKIDAVLSSPSETSIDFCDAFTITEGTGTVITARSSYSILGVSRGSIVLSRNCVYQGFAISPFGGHLVLESGNSVFDAAQGIDAGVGSIVAIAGPLYGTGITDVGIQLASGVAGTFSTTPTIAGTAGAARVGGTLVATYGALPTAPVLGAGLYPS